MSTILLVDDEVAVVEALRDILEDSGHRVLTAFSGREALARLAEDRPDLAIVDLMMPDMSGEEVLRAMHADSRQRTIPVALMSAAPWRAERVRGDAAVDPVAFLHKPFSLEAFLSVVNRVLST